MSPTAVKYSTRSTCRVCGSEALELLIDYGLMPLAGGFIRPEEVERLNIAFPLRLARCTECTLMQVLDTVSPEQIFSQYSYASSTAQTLIDHFAAAGPELVLLAEAKGRLVVEFGCNDGVLIRPLLAAGAHVVGVDPSDVARRASEREGWTLFQEYFDPDVAVRIRERYGAAKLAVGNNVLAHVDDVHAIVAAVTSVLDNDGLFVFEVHYQGDLLALTQFDTVYHEHTCYYSLRSLRRLLDLHGLKIVDVVRIPIHMGSIRVVAARRGSTKPVAPVVEEILNAEADWDTAAFVRRVQSRRRSIQALVRDLHAAGRRIAGYGAAGRATILLNYCGLGPDVVEYVADMSPLRYGRLIPGVLIPIVPPAVFTNSPPGYAVMTAWNYEREILELQSAFLRSGGRFIAPLPEVRIVGEV